MYSTSQKIEKLNEACKGHLEITSGFNGWNIYSNIMDTPLTLLKTGKLITAPTFDAVVEKAYKFVFLK